MEHEGTPAFEQGFETGVFYERTRIMESLKLDVLIEHQNDLTIDTLILFQWGMLILTQPIHTWGEAQHVIAAAKPKIIEEIAESLALLDEVDPDTAAAVRQILDSIGDGQ